MAVNYDQFKKYDVPCLYIVCNKCKLTTQNPDDKCKSKETGSKGAGCKMSSCKMSSARAPSTLIWISVFWLAESINRPMMDDPHTLLPSLVTVTLT